MQLSDLERLTKSFADARADVGRLVHALEDEVRKTKLRYLGPIQAAVAKAQDAQGALKGAVEVSAALFVKPRTYTWHGIRVGIMKGKGGLDWDDDDQVVALIEKHYPDQKDVLVKTTKKPVKKALEQLTAAELKKIGVLVEETGDVVFVKPTDTEVEKMVDALLKDLTIREAA